jgi:hypothetical protein
VEVRTPFTARVEIAEVKGQADRCEDDEETYFGRRVEPVELVSQHVQDKGEDRCFGDPRVDQVNVGLLDRVAPEKLGRHDHEDQHHCQRAFAFCFLLNNNQKV